MPVLRCADIDAEQLVSLLGQYKMQITWVENKQPIPGSWFGDSEAGLIGNTLYIRADTPLHSALHEACHYICMPESRRQQLNTNAGGDYDEENAVCFLSILLSDFIQGFGRQRMMQDMNEWGYTFRLGSSQAWFEEDAEDTFEWLLENKLIDKKMSPLWQLRK